MNPKHTLANFDWTPLSEDTTWLRKQIAGEYNTPSNAEEYNTPSNAEECRQFLEKLHNSDNSKKFRATLKNRWAKRCRDRKNTKKGLVLLHEWLPKKVMIKLESLITSGYEITNRQEALTQLIEGQYQTNKEVKRQAKSDKERYTREGQWNEVGSRSSEQIAALKNQLNELTEKYQKLERLSQGLEKTNEALKLEINELTNGSANIDQVSSISSQVKINIPEDVQALAEVLAKNEGLK
ncbi:hypothetical protein [Vibrio sp. TBV020]|uniref:hypothetical protein n=1 Tax=Vibrio sp. TBV020 TaxID=3137398 RepID=UPI0038CD5EB2